jgi:hypothetical protein
LAWRLHSVTPVGMRKVEGQLYLSEEVAAEQNDA